MPEPADIIAGYRHTGQVDTDAVNDMARRLAQARDRVVEAAKAASTELKKLGARQGSQWFRDFTLHLVAAVDALEEVERG